MACNRCNLKRIMALFKKQDEARKRAAQAAQNEPVVKEESEKIDAPVEVVVEAVEVPAVEEKPAEVVEEVKEEAPAEEVPVEEAPAIPTPHRRRTRKLVEEAPAAEAVEEALLETAEESVPAPKEEATPMEVETVTEDTNE